MTDRKAGGQECETSAPTERYGGRMLAKKEGTCRTTKKQKARRQADWKVRRPAGRQEGQTAHRQKKRPEGLQETERWTDRKAGSQANKEEGQIGRHKKD
jgi:hypothetical protein